MSATSITAAVVSSNPNTNTNANKKMLVVPLGLFSQAKKAVVGESIHIHYEYELKDDASQQAAVKFDRSYSEYKQFRSDLLNVFPWLALPPLHEPLIKSMTNVDEPTRKLRELTVQLMLFVACNSAPCPGWLTTGSASPREFVFSKLGGKPLPAALAQQTTHASSVPSSPLSPQSLIWIPESDPGRFPEGIQTWTSLLDWLTRVYAQVCELKKYFEKIQESYGKSVEQIDVITEAVAKISPSLLSSSSSSTSSSSSSTSPASPSSVTAASSPSTSASPSSAQAAVTSAAAAKEEKEKLRSIYKYRSETSYADAVEQMTVIQIFVDGAKDLGQRRLAEWKDMSKKMTDASKAGAQPIEKSVRDTLIRNSSRGVEKQYETSFLCFRETFETHWKHSLALIQSALPSRPAD